MRHERPGAEEWNFCCSPSAVNGVLMRNKAAQISALPRLESEAVTVCTTTTGFSVSVPITQPSMSLDDLSDGDGKRPRPFTDVERQARRRKGIKDGSMAVYIRVPYAFIEAALDEGWVSESESEDKRAMADIIADFLDKAGREIKVQRGN
jgi:hypothetical protein